MSDTGLGSSPRFSVIVPVFKVHELLRECMDSVLGQDFTDFEVIAVDDRSPDHSGEILDEYAARDRRVKVLHLPENGGLGRARNAGLERARGDYLLFLDSDDTLTPGALGALAARLSGTEDPDILVFDYARTYWDGKVLRNQLAALLAESGAPVFSLAERPELLDLLQIACNKAYRRSFVEEHGFRFPPGYYEDAPWTFCTMITAQRIAVLDRVCLHYRQRRQGGNILGTTSRKHFDVFDQYARVFAYLDAHPELRTWHPHLFRKMIDHYLTVLDKPGRLPQEARAEFFHRAASDYRRLEPEGFVRPGGVAGGKYAVLARDLYPALAGVKSAGRIHRGLRRQAGKQLRQAKRTGMDLHYRSQLRRPLEENLAVFSSYWGRSVACNPAAIDRELARLAPHIRRVWAIKAGEEDKVPAGTEFVRVGSREFWTAVARAKFLVNNANFADKVVKREGSVHLQTHHGTPLKSMGLDQQRFPASAKGVDFEDLMRRCDRWDFSLSANRFSTEIWERVYPCSYTSLEYGYPRNDILLNAGAAEVARARRSLGLAEGTVALLYAPTHRDHEPGFTPRLDLAALAERLGPRYTLMVRAHYFYKDSPDLAKLRADGRVLDVSGHPSVEELCLASDALITDYSSVMFDFANLDRPIVTFADDWDVYAAVRGVYFDLLQEGPGAVATTPDELVEVFRSGAWQDARAARRRAAFRERFCEFDDGRAAERVVRRVFLGQTDLPAIVPLEQRVPAPAPALLLGAVPPQKAVPPQSAAPRQDTARTDRTPSSAPEQMRLVLPWRRPRR
ncbi:bifunctional glycosyltransferase family 2 protein/CDP-glycerol:glycerophosphate glycerophosphotransferase [Streptomyces sp. MST-110588]|uniref:bifunctional glycosyltransferase/CDP-glycerol:glycerophosphate glycerophosphotransferase n=1 Tax=Streptomyces sp. MST-110588 TaxID=2833628 RepID=UPI001F5CE5BF|nr:bifunctional glycosyltransferase family 2 protein/CDP-glycerol:glycerophosphate glycerophosphotransferase [Streptomyces sp. MST-110588]UNO43324.1 bifunctional glycosyltransferase family 2 protein/CDP-glycerol:glycerophosphate glycerophosphotransferase [Streptomyces sp. MST-110588]